MSADLAQATGSNPEAVTAGSPEYPEPPAMVRGTTGNRETSGHKGWAGFSWGGETMGTTYRIRIAGPETARDPVDELPHEVSRRLEAINDQMSHYLPGSELSRFNRLGPGIPFPVSRDFASVMDYSLGLHRRSGGVFDPALGSLIDAWGFGPARAQEPIEAPQLPARREKVGADLLGWSEHRYLRKQVDSVNLNLSAVAKGYAVDAVVDLLSQRGWENILVEIGGELAVRGQNPSVRAWQVGVRSPAGSFMEGADLAAVVTLDHGALATSGNSENFHVNDQGERLSHLIDPRSLRPVTRPSFSVTVWSTNCLDADGLATTLSVMGPETGNAWLKANSTAEALWVQVRPDRSLGFLATEGFPEWRKVKPDVTAGRPGFLGERK
ncbi:MAG: FAD:protein FMN transferase [Verrucomicrobiales bacterium]|nr:FAD:protein FMN transferase [Verrucomicrobiales bacterium]